MSWYEFRPYVPVAQRQRQAQQKLKKLKKKGQTVAPVMIEGRTIAKSFWGKSWCDNLERYSDFANRLPRGRTYVRNGSVVDLQIAKGEVVAFVAGSELYKIKIGIAPVKSNRWKSICRDCAGGIDSLVELLQGRLAKGVMDRVCREGDGLFPSPDEIKLSCSCPDWAEMCKHVAATLYGIGARLDQKPQLLFVLRGVDESELFAGTGKDMSLSNAAPSAASVLDDSDVAALFGLEMADTAASKALESPTHADKASNGAKANRAKANGAKTAKKAKTTTTSGAASLGAMARMSRTSSTRTNTSARKRPSRTSNVDHPAT
jgi:uncharacterized Zn finger protein